MTDSHRVPMTMCWHCDHKLDAASELTGTAKPEPGAVSLCLYCGAIGVFGPEMLLYPPDKETLDELETNVEFRQNFTRFSWLRQYIMIKENLIRDRSDPDR